MLFPPKKEEYFYIQERKTNVYIKAPALIPSPEMDAPLINVLNTLKGAVSYFLNYVVSKNSVFISISINAFPLTEDAKVFPYANATISRGNNIHETSTLDDTSGFWDESNHKQPVGSTTINLPPPNSENVIVKLELGYTAHFPANGTVTPNPPSASHTFEIRTVKK